MRALLLALLVFAGAGCGDDTTSSSPIDMSIDCGMTSSSGCCRRGIFWPFGPDGGPACQPNDNCSGFEFSCQCGSDGKWACHGQQFFDFSTPIFD
ncbi:MAG: hypothetical protein ACXVCV_12520 [Polyangia bacterium]